MRWFLVCIFLLPIAKLGPLVLNHFLMICSYPCSLLLALSSLILQLLLMFMQRPES